jgi:hypothetical protein
MSNPVEVLDDNDEPLLVCDGLEHAFIGVVEWFGQPPIACYDIDLIIDGYIEQGMTYEEADEFFHFNVLGAYVGPRTPSFIRRMTLEQLREELDET